MDKFDFAKPVAKGEGQPVTGYGPVTEPKVHTTWLEVCIPAVLESECYKAIQEVLRKNGFTNGWDL